MAGTGTIGKQLQDLEKNSTPATTSTAPRPASPPATTAWQAPAGYGNDGPLMLVPAGFFGNVLSSLTGTIGEVTGGFFGNAAAGKAVGDAASGLAKLLPFSIIPPTVSAQSAGPGGTGQGPSEALVVVPSAFLGGLLGGIGGGLLGRTVGDWLGDGDTGKTIGSTIGSVVGGILPFSVIPPSVLPQSAGPGGTTAPQEPLVVVPAGFFGNLLAGVSSVVTDVIGGDTARSVNDVASPLLKLLPFQTVPPALAPQSAGPDGTTKHDDLVVLPAGFFGSLLSGLAGTVGKLVGGDTGQAIGNAAAPIIGMIPFHALPPELAPQSAGPDGASQHPDDQLMLVPAGLFSGLLAGLAGTVGGVVGGMFGDSETGTKIGDAASGLIGMLPFHTIAPQTAAN